MKKVCFSLALLAVCFVEAAGQTFETGYFLDGYTYAYRMNPALQCERGFFAIPAAGKLDASVNTSLQISDFLYNRGGKTVTFLHPDVSREDFYRTISPQGERGAVQADLPLFALGFWTGDKTFHTLDANVRGGLSARLPGDLFRFLKNGTEDATAFEFSDLGLSGRLFGEVAYGVSHRFNSRLTFGLRLKGLLGFVNASATFDRLRMDLGADKWTVQAQGGMKLYGDKVLIDTRESQTEPGRQVLDYSTIRLASEEPWDLLQPSGFGAALDLGLVWSPLPVLRLSASLQDLGFMYWPTAMQAKTPDASFTYDPSDRTPVGEGTGDSIAKQLETAFSGFDRIAELQDAGSLPSLSPMPFTVRAGAQLFVPFYKRLSVGFLGTWIQDPVAGLMRGRASVNWALLNWLSLAVSGSMDSFQTRSLGAAVNLHTGFLTLFVGTDHLYSKGYRIPDLDWQETVGSVPVLKSLPEPLLPDKLNLSLTFGLNLTVGRRHVDHAGRLVR